MQLDLALPPVAVRFPAARGERLSLAKADRE